MSGGAIIDFGLFIVGLLLWLIVGWGLYLFKCMVDVICGCVLDNLVSLVFLFLFNELELSIVSLLFGDSLCLLCCGMFG